MFIGIKKIDSSKLDSMIIKIIDVMDLDDLDYYDFPDYVYDEDDPSYKPSDMKLAVVRHHLRHIAPVRYIDAIYHKISVRMRVLDEMDRASMDRASDFSQLMHYSAV